MACDYNGTIEWSTPCAYFEHPAIPMLKPVYCGIESASCPHCKADLMDDDRYHGDNAHPGPYDCHECGRVFMWDTQGDGDVWTVPIRTEGDITYLDLLAEKNEIPKGWPVFERKLRSHFIKADCGCFKEEG